LFARPGEEIVGRIVEQNLKLAKTDAIGKNAHEKMLLLLKMGSEAKG